MSLLTTQPAELRDRRFQFDAGLHFPGGRVEIWEDPEPVNADVENDNA